MTQAHTTDLVLYRALEAALELAQSRSWASLTLIEIAAHGSIDLADLYGVASKDTLTDALESWSDRAMSAEPIDQEDLPQERLFDVIMRRFEHMEPYRAAILSLMQARNRSSQRRLALVGARHKSADWALSCAGLDHGSAAEHTAQKLAIAWIIGRTERAWRKDESGDFAQTMAVLDAELKKAEERFDRLRRFRGRAKPEASAQADPVKPEKTSAPEAPPGETDPA